MFSSPQNSAIARDRGARWKKTDFPCENSCEDCIDFDSWTGRRGWTGRGDWMPGKVVLQLRPIGERFTRWRIKYVIAAWKVCFSSQTNDH